MTRRARNGRVAARTYRRARLPATVTALMALAAYAGSCTPLPDDDNNGVKKGTVAPKGGRRPDDGETGRVVKPDPCKEQSTTASSGKANKQADAQSVVLFQSDFETPNIPLEANCGKWLDQTGINELFGTESFQFAQEETVEGVVLQDKEGIYTDPTGQGGKYAIGMLADLQEDRLAMSFTNALPFVNVRLDLSGIAIAGCGTPVEISAPRLKIDIYDTSAGKLNLKSPGREPLDSKIIEGKSSEDPWEFNWRTATASLDASGATNGNVTVVFDLLEGGYAAIDNLSVVSSTAKGVADSDNNGVADDTQCTGEGEGGPGGAATSTRDAGRADGGTRTPTDAGTPPAAPTPPPAAATPPAAPPAATPTPTPPATSTPTPTSTRNDQPAEPPSRARDAGTSSEDEEEDEEEDDEGSFLDRLRDAGRRRRS